MAENSWLDELLDETYRGKYADQGSETWEEMRVGRFTSSEWSKIMECGFRPMTPEELAARPKSGKGSKTTRVPDPTTMGEKGVSYVLQKVAETLTGKPKPQSFAYPIVYGRETEPEAVEHVEKVLGVECKPTGFHVYTDHAGGSPDRLIGDDDLLEIKCPFYSEHQISYLMLTDRFDLKREYPQYYWQVVTQLLFTGRKRAHFCTFDPRMKDDKYKLSHLILMADDLQDEFELATQALTGAVKLKLQYLNAL